MNKILSNIRSVPGVWGTIAIDKKRALTYQLLPASYDSEAVKNIAIPTLNLAQSCERPMVVDMFFEKGKARLYNRGETVVLILGREEMSFDALGVKRRYRLFAGDFPAANWARARFSRWIKRPSVLISC
jgi:hypothetical protein